MRILFRLLVISFFLNSCSGINQEHRYENWQDLPTPVQKEFFKMLQDSTGGFIHCNSLDGRGCNYENKFYGSQQFIFSNGEVKITQNIYKTSLKFFVIYNDTLYCSIKKSMTPKQEGKSLEGIVNLDTLKYKLIWQKN